MPRAIWTGAISFGLVNVPVRLYSAIDEQDVRFHLLHERDDSRIGYEKVCKKEGKPVPDDEIVRGYGRRSRGTGRDGSLADLRKAELEKRARKAGVEGRSTMTKDELVAALDGR